MPRSSINFGRFFGQLKYFKTCWSNRVAIQVHFVDQMFQAVPSCSRLWFQLLFVLTFSYRLCELFSGYIAPWLYCLKTWVSSSRLNSQISLAVVRIFWLYCPLARYIARSYIAKLFWDRNVALPRYLARLYYPIFLAT